MMHKPPYGIPGELSSLIINAAVRTGALAGFDSFMRQIDPNIQLSRSDTLTFVSTIPELPAESRLLLKEFCDAAEIDELTIFALRRYLTKSISDCSGFDAFVAEWCKTTDALPWIWRKSSEMLQNLSMMNIDSETDELLHLVQAAGGSNFISGLKNISKAIQKQGMLSSVYQILHLSYTGAAESKLNELFTLMQNGDESMEDIDRIISLTNEIEAVIQREYSLWHESIFGQSRVALLKEVFDSDEFRLARRFALINIEWPADIYTPPALLAQARDKYCPGGLLHDFVCPRCKLSINSPSPMPLPLEAKHAAEDALALAAIHLQNSEWSDNLRERMKRANTEMNKKCQLLLSWSRGEAELTPEILDDHFINWLNHSSKPIASRNTSEIRHQLSGHDLTHRDAKTALTQWLDPLGNLNDDAILTFE